MKYSDLYKYIIFPRKRVQYLIILFMVAIFSSVYAVVEIAGGTQFAHLHILYVPIILSGFLFSVRGGIFAGIVAGFLMSPFMPSIHAYDLVQPFFSWTLRMGFFTFVEQLQA